MIKKTLLLLLLCLHGSFFIFAAEETVAEMLAAEFSLPQASTREKIVSKRVFELLFSSHYQKYKITPDISAQWYENYFKLLDYNKVFFLASDLEEFRSYERILWNSRERSVNLELAFLVYERFVQRMQQWALYSIECLYKEPDFSVKEYLPTESDQAQWQDSIEDLQELWRLRVKNLLLLDKLQSLERENNDDKGADDDKPAWMQDGFVERQAKSFARSYKRRQEYESIQILEVFMSALAQLFDPHSAYMAPATKDNFDIDMSLSLQGIGATLTSIGPYTVVDSVVSGGPADKNGQLKEGDRIVAVAQDGEEPVDVVDMPLNRVVSQIRGPKNTMVHLTVMPEGSNSKQIVSILRDEIKLKDQEAQAEIRLLKNPEGEGDFRVLVLYLPTFYSDFSARSRKEEDYTSSSRDILRHINKAKAEGELDAVVLDLRGNGGGSLDEAVKLAGLFLDGGPVVQVKYYRGQIEKLSAPNRSAAYKGPLCVLVDKFSASASEIVAAALQDSGRALVLGDKSTHGKGTVQTVFELERDAQIRLASALLQKQAIGSLKFTIGKFYRINGSSTQVKGVIPDLVFPAFSDHMEVGEARLPHVMPWDEIAAAKYKLSAYSEQNRAALPALQEFIQQYMHDSAAFTEFLADVKFYAELRRQKLLPLELEERQAYQKKEKEAAAMYRKFQAQRKNSSRSRRARRNQEKLDAELESESVPPQDLILDASLAVMQKMLSDKAELAEGEAALQARREAAE
ncbi:MAG: carboxy terminal-processing peptidase [Lentisphaerae bacterium]|nr:carboxy terminal-processing peptidase [Lentisphaerota bacterium]